MRVAVIGAGAVGLGIGSCLLSRGVGIRFFVRDSAHRKALESEGLRRTGLFGEVRFGPDAFSVEDDLEALADTRRTGAEDLWLICVKSTASQELARQLAALWRKLVPGPQIVLFQNGWGNAEIFAEWIPREHIYNARVITGFARRRASEVEITVHADAIRIGSLFGGALDSIRPLARAIHDGGIPCECSPEIEKDLWAKLLYNVLLNPLAALLGVPYGVLAERSETRAIVRGLAQEVFCVLDATGYRTHWQTADEYLETFYAELLPPTAKHVSSMLQDLRAGRPSEIDALCGAICSLAGEYQLNAPLNQSLTDLIHAAENRKL